MSRKPEVWRGYKVFYSGATEPGANRDAIARCSAEEEERFSGMKYATVIEDGAVMPLDAATERLVEAVRIATHRVRMKERDPHDAGIYLLADALAAFDAERKGTT